MFVVEQNDGSRYFYAKKDFYYSTSGSFYEGEIGADTTIEEVFDGLKNNTIKEVRHIERIKEVQRGV